MRAALHAFFQRYGWLIMLGGILGNLCFLIGSICFLFDATTPAGIWLFIIGSAGMLLESVRNAIVSGQNHPD